MASKQQLLVLIVAVYILAHQGDCQCQQNFVFPGLGIDQQETILYDIYTCVRCQSNSYTILVAGSGVSAAPLTNATSIVTILPPSGSETRYTLMIPVPRNVLSNTAATIIGCGSEDIRFTELVFGDPMLNPSGTINVVEGTSGSLSCSSNAGSITGIDATWSFGSTTLITSADTVIYSYTNITRTQSGEYNCTLTHSIGTPPEFIVTRHGTVTINVQYSPEFIDGINSFCVGEGKRFSLRLNMESQPDVGSNFSWTKNGATYQEDVSATSLNISNVTLGDAGVYKVTASNSLGSDSYVFTLNITSLPTAPRNLAVINLTNISFTSIILRWQNPLTSGVPTFNAFLVELETNSAPFINATFNAISTDPSYTNIFTVTGLKLDTNYTASVRAVSPQLDMSCMEQGVAHSQSSNAVAFMTMAGVPEFSAINLGNTNGKLVVTWNFKHTGGAPLTTVVVTCCSEEEGGVKDSDMSCSGNMCGEGMVVIPTGPENVTAGMNYSCTIIATNELGNSGQQTTNNILATSGVPSVPIITNVVVGIQIFVVTVRLFAGHTSLSFDISVINVQTSAVTDTQTGFPSGQINYVITVPFTQSGRHQFTVSASNLFGKSASVSDHFSLASMPELEGSISTGSFVGVVVGLIAVILVLAGLLAAVLLYKKKWCEPGKVVQSSVEQEGSSSHSIELKDNAAYASVTAVSPESIATEGNIAYKTLKADPLYEPIK